MDPIQVIIEQLAQCGSKDATGRFQIDLAQARQRLADFRLEDQQLWLLPVLQLGHSWEAARVEVRFLRNSVKVAILGCQQRVDLSPWLSQVGHLGIWRHSRLGPLVMACEVALAAGFRAVHLAYDDCRFSLLPESSQGNHRDFDSLHQLEIEFESPDPQWWGRRQRKAWTERIAAAVGQLQQRGDFSLAQLVVDGRPVLQAQIDRPGRQELERVWLSRQPLRQLMTYPGPVLRPFRHDLIGPRLTHWGHERFQGQLREWVHAEGQELHSDMMMSDPGQWMNYILRRDCITAPREARRREGYLAVRGLMQWCPDSEEPGQLIPVRQGLVLTPVELLPCPGVRAWISGEAWALDLTQHKVVRNTLLQRSIEWLNGQFTDFLERLLEAAQTFPEHLEHLAEPVLRALHQQRRWK